MSLIIGMGQGGMQPSTPTIGTATAGNAQASVAFTPSTYIGKSTIVYRAISTPGGFSATSTTTPIVVTGLSNGTAYTFVVQGETPYGVNSLQSAASNSVTPVVPYTDSYESIASTRLTSTAATVTFSGISTSYTHLQVRVSARTNRAANANDEIVFNLNDDTAANYGFIRYWGNGGGSFGDGTSFSGVSVLVGGFTTAANATANNFAYSVHNFWNSNSTTLEKYMSFLQGYDNNSSTAGELGLVGQGGSTWHNTSAITKIACKPSLGTFFESGTTISLYGMKENA